MKTYKTQKFCGAGCNRRISDNKIFCLACKTRIEAEAAAQAATPAAKPKRAPRKKTESTVTVAEVTAPPKRAPRKKVAVAAV